MGVTSQLVDEYWERVLKSRVGVRTILRQDKSNNVGREGVVLGEGRAELYAVDFCPLITTTIVSGHHNRKSGMHDRESAQIKWIFVWDL